MLFNYEFKDNLDEDNFINNPTLGHYYADIIANIGLLLFNTRYFKVIIKSHKEDKISMMLVYKKQEIPILIDSDTVTIYHKTGIYTYLHNRGINSLYLDLTGVLFTQNSREIGEMFMSDTVIFTIVIDSKYFVLKIPMKPSKIYNPYIFDALKLDSNLINLKDIYQDYFLEEQKLDYYSYNLKETVLTIYDIIDDGYKLKNEIKLKGGFPVFEEYNTLVDGVQINVTINESKVPLITVYGYDLNSKVDLNGEVISILERVNTMHIEGKLRILRPTK